MFDFFEFSNEMLCIADNWGYFTRVNRAWTDTLGWSAAELTSRPYIDFVHPDDLQNTLREAQLLNSGTHETVSFENRYRAQDGTYRWISWRACYIPGTKELYATARDITHYKAQTEALRTAEERFRVLATQAPVCIFQSHVNGDCVFVNDFWCKLTGLSSEESLGLGWRKAIHPDDLARVLQKWEACAANKVEYRDEYRLLRTDGQVRHVIAAVHATKDVAGNDASYVGTLLDITERKAAEEALRLRDSQLTGILTYSPAVIYLKDKAGRYCVANFVRREAFRYLGDDVIGRTDLEIFPEAIGRRLMQADEQVWKSVTSHYFEEVLPQPDGEHVYRSYKFPVVDEMGQMIALGGVSVDITDLRTAHEALQRQEQLLRSLIEVQEKEKQFLCHEFHDGLIQYAVGSLMLLESYQRRHTHGADLHQIEAAIASLRKGVEDGRNVIRGIRPAVLDDSGMAAAIEDLVAQYCNSGIHITSQCDPAIGRLPESLQTTIYRVVQEALNNAHKHSGTDVVRIELQKVGEDLLLEVRDFGCGFDVEPARKRGYGLLGMTERVRLLGGECKITSQPDVGTCVSVRLPVRSSMSHEN